MALLGLADITDAVRRFLYGTRCFSYGGLAIGTTKPKITTANAIDYCIGGIMYTKAATADLFVFTDLTVQASGTTKYYLLGLDASGNASITPGTSTALPDCPSGVCPVGYVKIVTAVGTTFTPATTNLDAAGVTVTYVNLACAPVSLS